MIQISVELMNKRSISTIMSETKRKAKKSEVYQVLIFIKKKGYIYKKEIGLGKYMYSRVENCSVKML